MADDIPKSDQPAGPQQAVRFSSVNQEIYPSSEPSRDDDSLSLVNTVPSPDPTRSVTEEQIQELKDSSISLQKSHMQSARMDQFIFDPISLPPSRVPSGSSSNQPLSHTQSPKPSMLSQSSSLPLTPADSGSKDGKITSGSDPPPALPVTPQVSPPQGSASQDKKLAPEPARQAAQPASMHDDSKARPKQPPPSLNIPRGEPISTSREGSAASTPKESGDSGHAAYPPSLAPVGDPNDPYARTRRPPQNKNLDSIDARFVFQQKERPRSLFGGAPSSPRASVYSPDTEKRSSVSSIKKEHAENKSHHGSMSDLKRFLKIGGTKREKTEKSGPKSKKSKSGTATPPSRTPSTAAMPFADDHGLEGKYGRFERMLGSGAGGSVRLMKRADGVTFAVKQFRDRHAWETERVYNKKITAEFCIGSTLHHGNVIEALDIVNENNKWYEVMEYAPYDLFNIVMSGKMSREEVACCTMQIINGVSYLHSMGLAHRDLKLDNVVVNEHGILKIIDFGSAHVFQYPFEKTTVPAEGVVGSDPYLAPEVFTQKKYDAARVDVWSLAIIFCCMTLRRFPWKCPKTSDNSYKLFTTQPTEDELKSSVYPQQRLPSATQSEPASRASSEHHHHHHRNREGQASSVPEASTAPATGADGAAPAAVDDTSVAGLPAGGVAAASTMSLSSAASTPQPPTPTVIKGPWRLLRLLPRETRGIVGRMLEVDPERRASLADVTADAWVCRTPFCRQEVGGRVVWAEGHTHVLRGGGEDAPDA